MIWELAANTTHGMPVWCFHVSLYELPSLMYELIFASGKASFRETTEMQKPPTASVRNTIITDSLSLGRRSVWCNKTSYREVSVVKAKVRSL